MMMQLCQANRIPRHFAIAGLLLTLLAACAGGNPERRPYLINETMDRAEKHRQAGETLEAAEMYHTVLLADPLNQIALNHLKEIGLAGGAITLPSALGINLTRAKSAPSLGWAIGLYPLNRALDLLDVLSLHLGLEEGLLIDAHMTRALQAGAGGGGGLQFGWWQKRNLGLGAGYVGELALGPGALANEGFARAGTGGLIADQYSMVGLNRPTERAFQRNYDYYGVGFRIIAVPVGASIEFHPLEIADALGGFFLLDFLHDDIGQTVKPKLDKNDRTLMETLVNTLSTKELRQNLNSIEQIASAPAPENPEGKPAAVMTGSRN